MNLSECTLVELRQIAKEKGIKNVTKLKKEELISVLGEFSNQDEEVASQPISSPIPKFQIEGNAKNDSTLAYK